MTADLDDVPALGEGDPSGMLLELASAGAQVREAASLTAAAAGLAELVADGRPRAVVVCGMGGAGTAGDLFAAVAGAACPVPVLTHRGFGLPGWAGVADLVVAVSSSGTTEETLTALDEAVRRGCRLVVVTAPGSPLAELGQRGRAVSVPVRPGRTSRAALWSLTVPLVVVGNALGLLTTGADELEQAASTLERVAVRCRPDAETALNPAKTLASELDGALPVVWGSSALTGAAAARFACQLSETAAVPATWGTLPEAGHTAVGAWTGSWSPGPREEEDFFRDREQELARPVLHLVLLRAADEHPEVGRRADAAARLAQDRGLGVTALAADGDGPLARLASLVGLTDFAAAYLALLAGIDPSQARAGLDARAAW